MGLGVWVGKMFFRAWGANCFGCGLPPILGDQYSKGGEYFLLSFECVENNFLHAS
jgi:hypothetical protein